METSETQDVRALVGVAVEAAGGGLLSKPVAAREPVLRPDFRQGLAARRNELRCALLPGSETGGPGMVSAHPARGTGKTGLELRPQEGGPSLVSPGTPLPPPGKTTDPGRVKTRISQQQCWHRHYPRR